MPSLILTGLSFHGAGSRYQCDLSSKSVNCLICWPGLDHNMLWFLKDLPQPLVCSKIQSRIAQLATVSETVLL